ncbi:melanocortin receptor 5-like [Actinia tenebrosa]|uniref:Melanocortin receptor 5-like n=1 Tax=Actinia tenebrosa TaxID=6105 RepID=A0A6P8ITB0_ACTTE|nr:melanocortin receptor 5-like [Actinia tenebrosa]
MNSVLSVLSVTGNSLVLLAINKTRSLRNPSYCVLFSLAVVDFCVGLFALPSFVVFKAYELKLSSAESLEDKKYYFEVYCAFGLIADGFGLMLSLVSGTLLGVVSVEKYLAIVLHLRYAEVVTNERVIKVVIGIWIFALSLTVWLFAAQKRHLNYITIVTVASFFLVLFLVIFCNVKIALILRKHKKQIADATKSTTIQMESTRDATSIKRYKKSVSSMAYVMILYLLCFVPHGITMLIKISKEDYDFDSIIGTINITIPLVFLNSSLNPLLYCWRFRDIRSAVVRIIKKVFRASPEGS